MDVIGFLCVSLGSSTVQLHDSLGSRRACACSEARFSSQNGDLLEESSTEEQRPFMRFLWANWHNAKDIHKCFLFTMGSVCHVNRFRAGSRNVAETTVKWLLFCGFRHTSKAIGQVYQCWWRICSNIACFTFYIHLWRVYWPSIVHTGFLLDLFFEPEDGGDVFVRNVVHIQRTTRRFIPEDRTKYSLCLFSSFNVGNEISHPYKTTGRIIVLYVLIRIIEFFNFRSRPVFLRTESTGNGICFRPQGRNS
jgi:hypothetical protein